jgi:excinuclease ABC subunit C
MAHLQGTDYVGSMVVMEDGLPNKREYRRFRIKDVVGNNDYAAMKEVLHRRLSAYISERDEIDEDRESRPKKFAYPPQLLLVDGGKGQLGVAVEVVNELGLADEIPVAAIAKKFEEIYVPGRSEPIRIPRGSESLFMLQRIRDEAHRFANTFHRESRSKRMVASSLEGVEGLGEARAKRLVKELGSVKAIKSTSLEDLIAISWLPAKVARSVFMHLHKDVAPIEETVEGDDA